MAPVTICDSSLCDTSFDPSCPCSQQEQVPLLDDTGNVVSDPEMTGNLVVSETVFGFTSDDEISIADVVDGSTASTLLQSQLAGQKASVDIIGPQGASLTLTSGQWVNGGSGPLPPGVSAPAQVLRH